MAFWRAARLQQARWIPAMFGQGRTALTGRGSILQWTIAGTVGIMLGIYTLGVSFLPPQWVPLFVLAALCPFIAMIVGNVRRLLLAVILLDIPFHLDIHLNYRADVADLGALGGWSISTTTVAVTLLYALWLGEQLTRGESRSGPLFRTSLPLTLYLFFTTLSVIVARDVTLALFEIWLLLQLFLLYVYIASSVRTRQDVLFIVTLLLIGVFLESLVMIGLQYIGQNFDIGGLASRIDVDPVAAGESYRVSGTIGAPNSAASYLTLLLAPALSLTLTQLRHWYKWLAVLAFSLGGVALIFTFSRGGWLVFALSIMILCILAYQRGWLQPTTPLVVTILVGLLLFLFFQDAIVARLFGDDKGSGHSRIPLMKLAYRIIKDHLILGVGVNNFVPVMKEYWTPEFGGEWLYTVHNKYLLVWAESGIGALLAFISFLVVTIWQGWQCWKFNDRFLSPLALGFTAAIIGHMAHMFIDTFHSRPLGQLLWFIAALITAMRHMEGEG